jgi:hypothetical protein
MRTTSSGDTPAWTDRSALSTDGPTRRFGGASEPEPAETDDAWPLEVWLSREEPEPDVDTWHAGTVQVRAHAEGGLRARLAARRRRASWAPTTH